MEVAPYEASLTEAAASQHAERAPEINFTVEKRPSQSDMPSLDLFDSEPLQKPSQEESVTEERAHEQGSDHAGATVTSADKEVGKSADVEDGKSADIKDEKCADVEDGKSADVEDGKCADVEDGKSAEKVQSEVTSVEEKAEGVNQLAMGLESSGAMENVTSSLESVEDGQRGVSEEVTESTHVSASNSENVESTEKSDTRGDNYSENAEITENSNNVENNCEEIQNNEENISNEVSLNNQKVVQDEETNNVETIDKKEVLKEEKQNEETNAGNPNEAVVNLEESVDNKENAEVINEDTPNDSGIVNVASREPRYVIEEDPPVKDEPTETPADSITEVAAESSDKDAVGTEESTSIGECAVLEAETTVVEIAEPQEAVASSQEYVQEIAILESSEAESAVAEILPREYEHAEAEHVQYQVILSEAPVNGVHETDKPVFQGQVIEIAKTEAGDIVAIAGDIQSESYIALPSETVTEVTFTDAVEQQMMVLPELEDQMMIMEECEPEEGLEEKDPREDTEKLANIPCHVLGRSVDKPLVDPVKNGRVLLKPRLGVKIPYRNLTSQIVSKQEIAEELMERSRLRQSNADPPAGGDVFFAQKLAQRLARKLEPSAPSTSKNTRAKPATPKKPAPPAVAPKEKIIDNSDLIALLEGDDVPDWNIARKDEPIKQEVKPPEWERELALKQLKELPKNSRSKAKGREVEVSRVVVESKSKVAESKPKVVESKPKVVESKPKVAEKVPEKVVGKLPKPVEERKEVENKEKESVADDDEKDMIEPRFSSMQVVKTYTRKRKPLADDIMSFISPKKPVEKVAEDSPPVLSLQKPINQSTSAAKTSPPKNPANAKKPSSTSQKSPQKSAGNLKPASKATPAKTPVVPDVKETPNEAEVQKPAKLKEEKNSEAPKKALSPNTYISKSSRIVKRKKIWDPDEVTPSKLRSPKIEDKSPTPSPEKKPKLVKPSEKAPVKEKPEPPAKPRVGRPPLRRTEKLLKKAKQIVKKTRLTEVDRLLMDEGAVNMLYSVKNTEELLKQTKKRVISLDRAQEDLLNKTNEIKNDLQISSSKDSPISLRKKEGTPKAKETTPKSKETTPKPKETTPKPKETTPKPKETTPKPKEPTLKPKETTPKPALIKEPTAALRRKKSKDSLSGSVHSPPASPGFAYAQHADASRIIRRHSSSSFSSEANEDDQEREKPKKEAKKKKKALGVDKQALTQEMTKNFGKSLQDAKNDGFSLRKLDSLVQIILAPDAEPGHTVLSAEILMELAKSLESLDKDNSCKVVLISSSGHSFCQGINYKELACADKNERQKLAETFATAIRSFLLSLTKFSKLLVAGVHGNTVGLGVTMLPLFDMVLASDSATFSAPYARLGCAVEGGALLALPHVMHNALASELFFASRKLTAAEALRWGLVTRTLWPDKFQEELVSVLKSTSEQSLQSMQTIKKQLRPHLSSVEASLQSESALLAKCWVSPECQESFGTYSLETK